MKPVCGEFLKGGALSVDKLIEERAPLMLKIHISVYQMIPKVALCAICLHFCPLLCSHLAYRKSSIMPPGTYLSLNATGGMLERGSLEKGGFIHKIK